VRRKRGARRAAATAASPCHGHAPAAPPELGGDLTGSVKWHCRLLNLTSVSLLPQRVRVVSLLLSTALVAGDLELARVQCADLVSVYQQAYPDCHPMLGLQVRVTACAHAGSHVRYCIVRSGSQVSTVCCTLAPAVHARKPRTAAWYVRRRQGSPARR
jgi:hypothetical protein